MKPTNEIRPIDADSLLNDLNHDIKFLDTKFGMIGSTSRTLRMLRAIIEGRSTLDVAPVKHAHWEPSLPERRTLYSCSNCHFDGFGTGSSYCPCCGAKMDDPPTDW